MKTEDFTNDAEVAALVEAFERATIPPSEFTHAAHVAVAVSYVARLPLPEAQARMRERLLHFTAVNQVDLYHETLTTFWMRLLDHVTRTYDAPGSGEAGQLQQETESIRTKVQPEGARRGDSIDPIGCPSGAKWVDLPLWQRINLIVTRWGTSAPVKAHYSPEVIKSKVAREEWVPPDRLPIPF